MKSLSSLSFAKEPLWFAADLHPNTIEAHWLPWLLDRGSLTERLVSKSKGDFFVKVLRRSICRPRLSEQQVLKLPLNQWAMIREVILFGNNTPWVYARTVVPLSTLHGPLRRLYYLGNQSLGSQLFSHPNMYREPVHIARVDAEQLPNACQCNDATWGRRSIFRLSGKPLLVSETFLPALMD